MKKYKIVYVICGRKYQFWVEAESEAQARELLHRDMEEVVRQKINQDAEKSTQ